MKRYITNWNDADRGIYEYNGKMCVKVPYKDIYIPYSKKEYDRLRQWLPDNELGNGVMYLVLYKGLDAFKSKYRYYSDPENADKIKAEREILNRVNNLLNKDVVTSITFEYRDSKLFSISVKGWAQAKREHAYTITTNTIKRHRFAHKYYYGADIFSDNYEVVATDGRTFSDFKNTLLKDFLRISKFLKGRTGNLRGTARLELRDTLLNTIYRIIKENPDSFTSFVGPLETTLNLFYNKDGEIATEYFFKEVSPGVPQLFIRDKTIKDCGYSDEEYQCWQNIIGRGNNGKITI